jgi:hypothetical protein
MHSHAFCMLDKRRAVPVGFRPMTVSDLIHLAGGRAKLAETLGCRKHSVHMWQYQGVPHKHHARLRAMLRRRVERQALAEALEWRPSK